MVRWLALLAHSVVQLCLSTVTVTQWGLHQSCKAAGKITLVRRFVPCCCYCRFLPYSINCLETSVAVIQHINKMKSDAYSEMNELHYF